MKNDIPTILTPEDMEEANKAIAAFDAAVQRQKRKSSPKKEYVGFLVDPTNPSSRIHFFVRPNLLQRFVARVFLALEWVDGPA